MGSLKNIRKNTKIYENSNYFCATMAVNNTFLKQNTL